MHEVYPWLLLGYGDYVDNNEYVRQDNSVLCGIRHWRISAIWDLFVVKI